MLSRIIEKEGELLNTQIGILLSISKYSFHFLWSKICFWVIKFISL